MKRREFVLGAAVLLAARTARTARAQQQQPSNFAPMEQGAYRPTMRPARPNATPQVTDAERDAFEHQLKCQCGCTLDVYTCRTTDFTCSVSPAMHRDVMRLIAGGYSLDEIRAAFVETYGEVALTAPVREGFNWVGYFAPGLAIAVGAAVLAVVVRKWSTRAVAVAGAPTASTPPATDDELARLERAVREEE